MKIQLIDVCKAFETDTVRTQSLDKVSLSVEPGEFIAVVGPSGSGKSTLLNAIGLLDRVDSGEIRYGEQRLEKLNFHQLARFRAKYLGFVFQSFNLLGGLNVLDNVILPLRYAGVRKKDARRRGIEVIDRLNLSHRLKHFPYQLSGGQQQRVAIARAIINQPKLLLADEPTGNLDSENGQQVMNLLSELHLQGTTILMVTHSMKQAGQAERIVRMQDGSICSPDNANATELSLPETMEGESCGVN